MEHDEYLILDIDCPIERLLPPNLEVLRVTLFETWSEEELPLKILERKSEIVPHLRRLVLTSHYRHLGMAQELRDAVAKEQDRRNYCGALAAIHDDFFVYIVQEMVPLLREACKREGVDLLLLWEDSVRKEILREGAGRAVWEITEQIAPGVSSKA